MAEQGKDRQPPPTRIIRHERPTGRLVDTHIVQDPDLRASLEEQRAVYRTRIAAITKYLGDGGEDRTEQPA